MQSVLISLASLLFSIPSPLQPAHCTVENTSRHVVEVIDNASLTDRHTPIAFTLLEPGQVTTIPEGRERMFFTKISRSAEWHTCQSDEAYAIVSTTSAPYTKVIRKR